MYMCIYLLLFALSISDLIAVEMCSLFGTRFANFLLFFLKINIHKFDILFIFKLMSWYSWNTAKVGIKHQSINVFKLQSF